MLYACVQRFDVTSNIEIFFWRTKQVRNSNLTLGDPTEPQPGTTVQHSTTRCRFTLVRKKQCAMMEPVCPLRCEHGSGV